MGGQCGKLVTVVGHQFITLTVDICVQHGEREAPPRAGLSAAAETSKYLVLASAVSPAESRSVENGRGGCRKDQVRPVVGINALIRVSFITLTPLIWWQHGRPARKKAALLSQRFFSEF